MVDAHCEKNHLWYTNVPYGKPIDIWQLANVVKVMITYHIEEKKQMKIGDCLQWLYSEWRSGKTELFYVIIFLAECSHTNPSARLTVGEAINHPFCFNNECPATTKCVEILINLIIKMKCTLRSIESDTQNTMAFIEAVEEHIGFVPVDRIRNPNFPSIF